MTVIYSYDETLNPDGSFLPGVPLRDLTQADLDAQPRWILPSIAAAPYYVAVAPLGASSESDAVEVATPKRKKSEA